MGKYLFISANFQSKKNNLYSVQVYLKILILQHLIMLLWQFTWINPKVIFQKYGLLQAYSKFLNDLNDSQIFFYVQDTAKSCFAVSCTSQSWPPWCHAHPKFSLSGVIHNFTFYSKPPWCQMHFRIRLCGRHLERLHLKQICSLACVKAKNEEKLKKVLAFIMGKPSLTILGA